MECAGFRQVEATTPDRRDDDPTGGNCVAQWDGVGTLESVGLVGDASAVVSDMVTPTAAVTSQWLAMTVGGVNVIHPSLGGRPQERRLGEEHPRVLSSQAGQCQVGGCALKNSARPGRLCTDTPRSAREQTTAHRLLQAQTVSQIIHWPSASSSCSCSSASTALRSSARAVSCDSTFTCFFR